MTALDRWRQIAHKWAYYQGIHGVWAEGNIMMMIAEAVAKERERCAKIADAHGGYMCKLAASAIRQQPAPDEGAPR